MRFIPPGLTILVTKLKNGFRLRPVLEPHETGGSSIPPRPMRDLSKLVPPDAVAIEVYPEQRRRELAALRRDAAISLLLEVPSECSERCADEGRCGRCHQCRVDKFLRDAGLRR